jgi:hypothetical protein
MEEKELLEVEAREEEQAKKNIEEMVRRKKMGDIGLLYRDKFDLEDKKVLFSGHRDVPPQRLIPICEKVLFTIVPHATADAFENYCGFSVEQVVEWREKGWVETVLSNPHDHYANLQYLDQLIEVSPSRSTRNEAYLTVLAGGVDKFNELLRKGRTLFKNLRVPDWMRREFGEQKAEDLYLSWAATDYVDLSVLGLTPVIERAEEMIRQDAESDGARMLLRYSTSYLVSPFTNALKKTAVYPSEERSLFKMLFGTKKYAAEPLFVPCWLADVYENLGATIPDRMDTDEINAVRKHSGDFVRAVKSLDDEIDKSVKQKFRSGELDRSEKEAILTKKEEFRKRWYEDVVPTFEDISRVKKAWSVALTGSVVVSLAALYALRGVLGVPDSIKAILDSGEIKKKIDPAAEFLSTFFECNPIHLGFYKVHRELKKVKEKAGKQMGC